MVRNLAELDWNRYRARYETLGRLDLILDDTQGGTTREGIHLGAMAGTIDLIQRCYAGLETRDDVLWLDPRLPEELHQLEFGFSYRGQHIHAAITGDRVELATTATTGSGAPVTVRVAGRAIDLSPGKRVVVELTPPQF